MSEHPAPTETALRLAALVKRSGDLAEEMKQTSAKMQMLTDQLARESDRAKRQAEEAKRAGGPAWKKP
jgi:hypothetical protein